MKRLLFPLLLLATPLCAASWLPLVNPAQVKQLQPGDTLLTQPTTTVGASFNLPPGTAPTVPNNGDLWSTSTGLFTQQNGVTVGPLGTGGSGGLPVIGSGDLLGNATGGSATASDTTLTALIDRALGSNRGSIIFRNATVWTTLNPGTSGFVLQAQGVGANPIWAAAGLPSIASGYVVGNSTAGTTTASGGPLTTLIDRAIGSTQGSILYRNSSAWVPLTPGSSGQFLETLGAASNPQWAAASTTLPSIAAGTLLGNSTSGSAVAAQTTVTGLLDQAIGATQGDVLYRSGTVWTIIGPGTSGQFLTTGGASANPSWTSYSLPTCGAGNVIGNSTGSSATVTCSTLSAIIDQALGSTQGSVLYRGASGWSILTPGTSGNFLETQGASANPIWAPASGGGGGPSTNQNTRLISLKISGGGTTIFNGTYVGDPIPINCTITDVKLLADRSGSVVVDIWKTPYSSYPPTSGNSITASDIPAISSTNKYDDSTLTGWTTAVSAGDTFWYQVSSPVSIQQLTIALTCVATT